MFCADSLLIVKIQQAAANNIISSSTWIFFVKNQPTKKTKNTGGKLEKQLPLYLAYVSHQGRFGQPRTNWRRGRLQKAATTRDRCVVDVCFFGLVATCDVPGTHLPNAKTSAIFQPHPDGTTTKQISYFGDPQTCLLYTSPSPRDRQKSRMPSSA